MSEIAKLWVSITAKTDELDKGLKGARDKMQSFGGGMVKTGGALTKGLTAPILLVGGAMYGMVNKTGQWADELLDLEAATGINTDQLQKYRLAAASAGTESDAIADSVMRMNRQMSEGGEYNNKLAGTAEKYGIALQKANGDIRDASEVHHDLMMAIAAIADPQERARAGAQAFGRDWEGIAPIVALGADELERLYETDVIDRDKIEQANDFRQTLDELKHSLGQAAMEVGAELAPAMMELVGALKDNLGPAVEKVVEFVKKLVDWWKSLSPETQKFIGIAIAVAAALGPVLMILGGLISVIGLLISPIGLVVLAVIALIAIGIALWKNWDTIKEKAAAIWGSIKDFFAGLWDGIKNIFSGAWEFIKNLFTKYHPLGMVIENWDGIKDWFSNLWEGIKGVFTAAWEFIKNLFMTYHPLGLVISNWEGIKEWFANLWDGIKNVFSGFWDWLQGFFSEWGPVILAVLVPFIGIPMLIIQNWEGISAFLINLWNTIKEQAAAIWETIKTAITEKVEALKTALQTAWDNIKNAVTTAWDSIKQAAVDKAEELRRKVIETIQKAVDWLKGLPSEMYKIGLAIIQGLINGIKDMAGKAWDAVKGVAGGIVEGVRSLFRATSPSKVFMEIGRDLGAGLEIGLQQARASVSRAMDNLMPVPEVAMSVSGGGAVTPSGGGGIINNFHIEKMQVRDEQDVEKIARELYRWQSRRGRGVN